MPSKLLTSFYKFSLWLLVLLFPVIAAAENKLALYESNIIYNEEDTALTHEVLTRQAFVKVLLKLTGDQEFKTLKNRNDLIKQAERLVIKFSSKPFFPEEKSTEQKQTEEDNEASNRNNASQSIKESGDIKVSSTEQTKESSTEKIKESSTEKIKESSTEKIKESSTEKIKESPTDSDSQLDLTDNLPKFKKFQVAFNPTETNKLLKKYNLNPWLSIRPETLVWLSIEKNNNRSILSESSSPKLFTLIQKQASEKGLNVKFPFVDLADTERLSLSDLWGDFPDVILSASQRYHAPSILTSRVFQAESGQWLANWSLYVVDRQIKWNSQDSNLNSLVKQGMTQLLLKLSDIFKIKDSERVDNSINVKINNVTSYFDFQRLESYLRKVSVINDFKLKFVTGDSLLFQINFVGSREHLLQNLAWGDLLQQLEQRTEVVPDDAAENEQSYKAVYLPNTDDSTDNRYDRKDDKPFSYKSKDKTNNRLPENADKSNQNSKKQVLNLLDSKEDLKRQFEKHKEVVTSAAASASKLNETKTDDGYLPSQKVDVEFWLRD